MTARALQGCLGSAETVREVVMPAPCYAETGCSSAIAGGLSPAPTPPQPQHPCHCNGRKVAATDNQSGEVGAWLSQGLQVKVTFTACRRPGSR
jgi:hypothetical protein